MSYINVSSLGIQVFFNSIKCVYLVKLYIKIKLKSGKKMFEKLKQFVTLSFQFLIYLLFSWFFECLKM